MKRSIVIEFDDPDAIAVVKSICKELADTEECAYRTSLVARGGGDDGTSKAPKADVDALRTLGEQVRALQRTLGEREHDEKGKPVRSSGMCGRTDRLVARITGRDEQAPDYAGATAAGTKHSITVREGRLVTKVTRPDAT